MKQNGVAAWLFVLLAIDLLSEANPLLAIDLPSVVFFVSALHGNDTATGSSPAAAFRTLARCAAAMMAAAANETSSSACAVGAGTYREGVTLAGERELRFYAASARRPVLSGLDVLDTLHWQRRGSGDDDCVYVAQLPAGAPAFQQLFYGGRMMVEARWPNLDVDDLPAQVLDRHRAWQRTGNGSRYGRIVSAALTQSKFSWDGALATLQVAHEYFTWSRTVANHTASTDSFEYAKDLPGLGEWGTAAPWQDWSQNKFYLSGKLEALDHPGEWFVDNASKRLYFFPPGAQCEPPTGMLEYKARDYVLVGAEAETTTVSLRGLAIRGATVSFPDCRDCVFEDLQISYPNFDREVLETLPPPRRGTAARTTVAGNGTRIDNVSIQMASGPGLALSGDNNTVTNMLVELVNWFGMSYYPVKIVGNHNRLLHSTVRFFGGAGVVTTIPNTVPNSSHQLPPQRMAERHLRVAYTHIHHGGLIAKDSAALYSSGWETAGVEWDHNWIHDCSEKCVRADDQSRNLSVHHNVVYNCGRPLSDAQSSVAGLGIVLKGDGHVLFANTLWAANASDLCIAACPERLKSYLTQWPRITVQNSRSRLFNSAAQELSGLCGCPNASAVGGTKEAIFSGNLSQMQLVNPARFDFRPAAGSPLIDAGAVVPPFTDGFTGSAPDVGAYEFGGDKWVAGSAAVKTDDSGVSPVSWRAGAGHVEFDPTSAVVTGVEAQAAGGVKRLNVKSGALPVFGVKVWPSVHATRSQELESANWQLDLTRSVPPLAFAYNYTNGAYRLTAIVRAQQGVNQLGLTISVTNTGSSSVTLAEVLFPRLTSLSAGADSELAWSGGSRGAGLRLADPVHTISSDIRWNWLKTGFAPWFQQDAWPHASMSWISWATPSSALYVGVHDAQLRISALLAQPSVENESIDLGFTANATAVLLPIAAGGSSDTPYTRSVVIAVVSDTAHTNSTFAQWSLASRIYRKWLEATVGAPDHPLWLRQGYAGVDISQDFPTGFYGQRETEIDDPVSRFSQTNPSQHNENSEHSSVQS